MSWLLAFAGFSALIILHEAGHFAVAKAVGMRVERFSLFFPPLLLRKRVGETEYAVGAVPLGGYVKISGMNPEEKLPEEVRPRAYFAQPVWKRVAVILAGPGMNFLLAFVLLFVFFWQIGPRAPTDRVQAVERGLPAAGELRPGDRIVSVDGRTGGPLELNEAIRAHRCAGPQVGGCRSETPARVVVERGGRTVELSLRPVYDAGAGPPRMRLGFSYDPDGPRDPFAFADAFDVTATQFWFIAKATASIPARIVDPKQREEITGVVGGYEVTRQTILADAGQVIGILAIISLSLAIVNLFPFLPLDGGHVFWALVEKVRRKPVDFRVMEQAGIVGFMLVIGLFAIGLSNDIGRLTGEGFDVR